MPGHVAPSYGIHCARMAGVLPSVLERAADILDGMAAGLPLRATRNDPRLAARNARCTTMVQALLDFDTEAGDVEAFLDDVRKMAAEADEAEQAEAVPETASDGGQRAGDSGEGTLAAVAEETELDEQQRKESVATQEDAPQP